MELSVDKSTKYFNKLNSFGNAFDQFSIYCFPLFIFIFTSVSTGFTAAHVIFYHAYKNWDDLILILCDMKIPLEEILSPLLLIRKTCCIF